MINPDEAQREKSTMHVVVSGTRDAVLMVEAGASRVSEDDAGAILFAHEEIEVVALESVRFPRSARKEGVVRLVTNQRGREAGRARICLRTTSAYGRLQPTCGPSGRSTKSRSRKRP